MKILSIKEVTDNFRGGGKNVYRVEFIDHWDKPNAQMVLGINEIDAWKHFNQIRGEEWNK